METKRILMMAAVAGAFTVTALTAAAQPAYYVSLDGADTDGISWDTAFHNVQTAINAARAAATPGVRATVYLQAHAFLLGGNGVRVYAGVDLIGQGIGASVLRTSGGVVMESDTTMEGVTLEGCGAACLLRIEQTGAGPIRLNRCAVDGNRHEGSPDPYPGAVGICTMGGDTTNFTISDCAITGVDTGLRTVNSGVNVTRCVFDSITGSAVLVEPGYPGQPDARVPLLGRADDIQNTGLNWYRNIGGPYINNTVGVQVLAEVCDWGVYDEGSIAQGVSGPADAAPFLGKSIGPGSVVVALTDQNGATVPASANPICGIQALQLAAQFDTVSQKYIMNAVLQGQWTVEATATGYSPGSASVNVTNMSVTPATLTLVGAANTITCGNSGKAAYACCALALWFAGKRRRAHRRGRS